MRFSFVYRCTLVGLLSALVLAGCRSAATRNDWQGRRLRHELVTALPSAPVTLDPRGLTTPDTAHIQQLIFSTLLKKGPNYDVVPDLAESWEMDERAMQLTVRMRKNVTFHHGKPCTARDVAFTFQSLKAGHYGKASAFSKLETVTAPDDLTVVFTNREPNPGLPVDLVAVGIIPENSPEKIENTVVGTGPFRVVEYKSDRFLKLESYPGYFGKSADQPDKPVILTVRIIPDAATRELELSSGSLDFLLDAELSSGALARWEKEPGWVVRDFSGGGLIYLAVNTERPGLQQKEIRTALASAINREELVKNVLGGRARLARSPLPPGHWALSDKVAEIKFAPQQAQELVQHAFPQEKPHLTMLVLPDATQKRIAEILQADWRAAGIEVMIQTAENQLLLDKLRYGDFDLALWRMAGGNQFTTIFKGAFHSRAIHVRGPQDTGELNYSRFHTPEIDRLIDAAQAAPFSMNPAIERAKYQEIQEKIALETPWITLWHPNHVLIARSNLDGFSQLPGGGGEVYFSVHWK
ncbi:MAG: ABC transporter substrate-binding protein [Blastocatellia bacterium]|nr:ABC transporter substrate-binding protein [Blastocatellia bacterium]